jgi:hypothetical protein
MSASTTIVRSGATGLWNSFSKLFTNSSSLRTVQNAVLKAGDVARRNPGRATALGVSALGAMFYDDIYIALTGSQDMTPEDLANLQGAVNDAQTVLCVEDTPCDPDLMRGTRMMQKEYLAWVLTGTCERSFLDFKNAMQAMCYKDLPAYRKRSSGPVLAAVALNQMLVKATLGMVDSAAPGDGGLPPVPTVPLADDAIPALPPGIVPSI